MIEVFDFEQGSEEWRRARMGIPTASEFACVIAKPGPRGGTSHKEMVGRTTYMRKLAGEILTRQPMDDWRNRDMERGTEREDEARALYELETGNRADRVGFIRNGRAGCSPDSLVGDDGMLELKDAAPHVQIERLVAGVLPPEHKAQVQGQMLVAERGWCDFCSHCRGLPPFIVRVQRDEPYIDELGQAVWKFVAELDALVAWLQAMR